MKLLYRTGDYAFIIGAKGKLFSLLRQLADPADAVVTFFAVPIASR